MASTNTTLSAINRGGIATLANGTCWHISSSELLKAKTGDAGLLVERLGSLRDGRAIEFSQSFYRGDTYDFVAELSAST